MAPACWAVVAALGWMFLAATGASGRDPSSPPPDAASAEVGLDPALGGTPAPAPLEPAPAPEAGSPSPIPERGPIHVLLGRPSDLDTLIQRLNHPDFVVLRGSEYRQLQEQTAGAHREGEGGSGVVDAVAIRGAIHGDLADLTIDYRVTMVGGATAWVAIGLDGHAVVEATAGDRTLPLRVAPSGTWQVELAGPGEHTVRVTVKLPVESGPDGRYLDLAIPEAASTQVQIDVDQPVVEAATGDDVAIAVVSRDDGARLQAHLTPRPHLDLWWRTEAEPATELPALLTASGTIELDIDPGSLRTRSSWDITAVRGSARDLELRLDPHEELLELELDGRPMAVEPERSGEATRVSVPMTEPLRPGGSRRLTLRTKRSLAPDDLRSPVLFQGFPFGGAVSQSGVLTIAHGGELWINGTPGPGVTQIDLRDLPPEARSRPSTVLAYRFVDQPFELGLRVEPSPPWIRVESRTTVLIDAGQAGIDTWLDYQVLRGRVFELRVGLPRGLEVESVGPAEVVAFHQWLPEESGAAPPDLVAAPRVLTLRLTPRASDEGRFQIHLRGRQSLDAAQPVPVALFQPREAVSGGGQIAVLSARNVMVDLPRDETAAGPAGGFRSAGLEPPADWVWPSDPRPALAPAAATLWLRYDGDPATLPLQVTVRPRTVHHMTTVTARIDRDRLEVDQETDCHVRFGVLTRVDLAVPPVLEGLWDVEGDDIASRDHLGVDPDGTHRYRLSLTREITDTLSLRFRYRRRIEPRLAPDRPSPLEVPWIRVLEGSASPPRLRVAADPGIGLAVEAAGWVMTEVEPTAALDDGTPVRLMLVGPELDSTPATLTATARALAPLPTVVATRLWLRTVEGPDGELINTAWYRLESHTSALSFALPADARFIRARVGGETVTELELLPQAAGYRLPFPRGSSSGPVLVGLEYVIPASAVRRGAWQPPQLLDGGLVQQTLWEVRVAWSRALLGVPRGWADENQWRWDGYVFKRQPWGSAEVLATWVAGADARGRIPADATSAGRSGYHSYLFSRPGDPVALAPTIVSRAVLVGLSSGLVLGVGVLLLISRPPGRLMGVVGLALALAIAVALRPNLTAQVAQASVLGLVLSLLALLIDRRRLASAARGDAGSAGSSSAITGSSLAGVATVGSDDSTAIRVRLPSTIDRVSGSGAGAAPAEHRGSHGAD